MPRHQEDEDEDKDYMPDEEYMPRAKRHKSIARSTSQEEPAATDSHYSESHGDSEELDAAFTAASYRPNPRRSATVAIDRMSKTSRTSRQPHRVEEQQEEHPGTQQSRTSRTLQQSQPIEEQQTSRRHVASQTSRASRHVNLAEPQQQDHRRAPQSQPASNVPIRPSPLSNMSLLRDFQSPSIELTAASGRPVRAAAISRNADRMSRQTQAGSSSAALTPVEEEFISDAPGRPARRPISREQQRKQNSIMVLYRSIFDSKLKEFPVLMTFEPIPDTWKGPPSPRASPAPPAAPPNTPSLNLSIPQIPEFDAFHQRSLTSTLRMQTPYGGPALPTPPLGYESYSFLNYPHTQPRTSVSGSNTQHNNNYSYLSMPSDVFGQAVPSLRTTPRYHPTNEMTPEQLQRYHNDRRLFVKMKAAWVDNEKVLRLRQKEGDASALRTLWDVAQVFRARNPLNPSAESIRWFVDLRDSILRPTRSRSRSRGRRSQRPIGENASGPAEEEEEKEEEGGHDNLEDLIDAANSMAEDEDEDEAEPEPEPEPEPEAMDVDEPEPDEPHQQQDNEHTHLPQANNHDDDDDDNFLNLNLDGMGPAFRMLVEMEQRQRRRAREALLQLEQEHQQEREEHQQEQLQQEEPQQQQREASVSSKGGFGINDLIN
ncbi:hypothetical protein SMACR_08488 [Sordaria macrospora]|uniref:WGS project CABT00000000 data, contig 2.58 n=2 Tax=Sordaria macrospora TaxID=5147 RepID=F7WA45_SORMK|nr:uncharacterized protein SMAC_08488 [Sordaria macrospora k-hell]KAA8634848.1 hypothetical protein SMACR_08488 [Sordaria macrospora]KAH7635133.1 hypothetical protein B0T09DRAFT_389270 [Sordaria sp. MPI-SDFR-AT-0083]WPJ58115.1 hypothetical protein SMAC4_08488 [Sordaria macrospora]CCC14147.1 unnamed protein product [Sordaria macrospora k-hell]